MENMQKLIEKRQHERFHAKDGAFTVCGHKAAMIHPIINISANGMAIRYAGDEQPFNDICELDIFLENSNFYIEKLQAKAIFDVELVDASSANSKKIRQRGFQFGEMKSSQKFQVNYFLQNYSIKTDSHGVCPAISTPLYARGHQV